MSVLVDWQIEQAIETGLIEVSPYEPNLVQPNSLDVRLGNDFVYYHENEVVIDPYREPEFISHYNTSMYKLEPGEFVLGTTIETIRLPDNIVATIEGKSSIARLGISIHQTGGFIDAGFNGQITLEIANLNCRPVRLYAGMPIGQIVFYETEHAWTPYNEKADAKYCGQIGATVSKYYENTVV